VPQGVEYHSLVSRGIRKVAPFFVSGYTSAPSFAYIIGEYTLDRNGVLTGPRNSQLLITLDQNGYHMK
jgi:hypothetical protein